MVVRVRVHHGTTTSLDHSQGAVRRIDPLSRIAPFIEIFLRIQREGWIGAQVACLSNCSVCAW